MRMFRGSGFVSLAFLAIAAFFIVTEHTAHFFGVLPYLLLPACLLLHLFHDRHGGGHGGHGSQPDRDGTEASR